ncbi:uncharacterized protein LTR77_001406 [Saxophila tyrrhenica]|uniref:Helicase-associated domain-containing protein n=1 Tax=Saxophila tyrrhenica TaxID=1690608 RepID=A0AAV9PNG3_9PEZI|nr:hypothetical protein LTR77_001406 [Saxophila tyrrhenica]
MDCPRCTIRLTRPAKRLRVTLPARRAFHASPAHSRLGAQTYAQEWQTGSYHFNKAHTKTLPVAAKRTDELLTNWMTQQKRRAGQTDSVVSQQLLRNQIAAQRRKTDTVLVSNSTAKDFGDRVEVTAFIYNGVEAAEQEEERKRQARKGVKAEGGEGGGNKRGPVRRRRGPVRPGDGNAPGAGMGGGAGPGPGPGVRRASAAKAGGIWDQGPWEVAIGLAGREGHPEQEDLRVALGRPSVLLSLRGLQEHHRARKAVFRTSGKTQPQRYEE